MKKKYGMTYFSFLRKRIINPPEILISESFSIPFKVALNKTEKNLFDRLLYGMEVLEWYKNPACDQGSCEVRLGLRKESLSPLFQKTKGFKFEDLINHYRVNFVKNALRQGGVNSISLEKLSIEAGFVSRTNFYRAFLKMNGINPSQFG